MDIFIQQLMLQIIVLSTTSSTGTDTQFIQPQNFGNRQVFKYRDTNPEYSPQPYYVPVINSGQAYNPSEQPVVVPAESSVPQKTYTDEPKNYVIITSEPSTTNVTGADECQDVSQKVGVFYNMAEKHSAAITGSVTGGGHLYTQDYRTECPDAGTHKYRTYDGTCNHPNNLGAAFTPLARLLPPQYDDGVDQPRSRGEDGQPLPSPRLISRHVHPSANSYKPLTHMVMQWGQWVDHDMTGVLTASDRRNPLKCCDPDGGLPTVALNKSCFPIVLTEGENYFVGKCMEFVRSVAATDSHGVQTKPREQVNSLNAFIDASQVYGASAERAAMLRDANDSLLRTKGDFPPENPEKGCILRNGTNDYCFLTGDLRTHENPALAAFHVVWLREHNRMVRELHKLSPGSSKEEIFQLARRIIGAIMQVITYNDYLPLILGRDAYRLRLISRQGRTIYNPDLDPRIFNEFSAAAFRFGHSSIPTSYIIGDRIVPLRELFSRPAEVLDNLDSLILGLSGVSNYSDRSIQTVDRDLVSEVTRHLFQPPNATQGKGLDLASLNIQRGRDHGIPPYTRWRHFCGLRPLYGFNDTAALGPHASELSKVYRSVNDIDLFTGIVHEPIDIGLVGPTGRCLLGIQFARAKYADRFFYDNNIQLTAFNDVQVQALRNVTFSKIICQNTKINALPLNIFRFANPLNPLVPCSQQRAEGLPLSLFV